MSASLMEPVSRATPINWLRIVRDALESVEVAPLAPSLVNTLTALNSYSAAPATIYANPASGMKDVQVHVALLRALDKSVCAWPAALRRQICAPVPMETSRRQRQRTPSRGRGSEVLLEGVRPLSEAALVLYNAAVANLDAGLTDLDRIRGVARLEVVAAKESGSSGGSVPPVAGPLRAPNASAKAAHRHFLASQQLAAAAMVLLGPTNYGVALSLTETQYLRSLVDFQGMKDLAAICTATTKYIYSLSSNAIGSRHKTLARLAFDASTLVVPECVVDPSARLLPSVLLAAYHRHRAEHYYEIEPQVSDMANALGHIRLAESILCEVDRQYDSRHCNRTDHAEEKVSAQGSPQNGSAWSGRLWSALRALSASPEKRPRSPAGGHEDGDAPAKMRRMAHNDEEEPSDGEEDLMPSHRNSSFCTNLAGGARDADDYLYRLFPILGNFLRRVRELSNKYEKENNVVYFAKVAPLATVQADVPDVEEEEGKQSPNSSEAALLSVALPPPSSVVDNDIFDALPSTTDLTIRVIVHQQKAQQQEAVLEAVERLSGAVGALKDLSLPSAVEEALEALRPCVEPPVSSVWNALVVVQKEMDSAWARHEEAARHWSAAQARLLCSDNSKAEVSVGPAPLTLSLDADVQCWTQSEREAAERWQAAIGPLDVASTRSIDAIKYTLLPEADAVSAFVERCTRVVDSIVSSDTTSSAETEKLTTLKGLQEEGEALLRRLAPLYDEQRWRDRLAAIEAMASVTWDAAHLVNRLDEGTARLNDETVEATAIAEVKAKLAEGKLKPKAKKAAAGKTKRQALGMASVRDDEEEMSDSSSAGFRTPREASDTECEEEANAKTVTQAQRRKATVKRKAKKSIRRGAKGKKTTRKKR